MDDDENDPTDSATPIPGATDAAYTPVLADVGSVLVVVALPYRISDGLCGTPVRAATAAVGAGGPTAEDLTLVSVASATVTVTTSQSSPAAPGEEAPLAEGSTLLARYNYAGGHEGESELTWSRVDPATGVAATFTPTADTALESGGGCHHHPVTTTHVLGPADTGLRIRVRVVPRRASPGAAVGQPCVAETPAAVVACAPLAVGVALANGAHPEEAVPITVRCAANREFFFSSSSSSFALSR
jgi:hypothetical protein